MDIILRIGRDSFSPWFRKCCIETIHTVDLIFLIFC